MIDRILALPLRLLPESCLRRLGRARGRPPGLGALWTGVLALLLIGPAPWARAAEDFLEPAQAFRLQVRAAAADTVALRFAIAPGYYLYRERFALDAGPVAVHPAYPAGQVKYDETFQKDVEVFHDEVEVPVRLSGVPAGGEARLQVTSQGCAERGLCYPPRTEAVGLRFDASGALVSARLLGEVEPGGAMPGATGPGDAGALPGDRFSQALRSGSAWQVAGVFLLAGVLLSFTPCVLPMVPILSSIIVGQGAPASRGRALALSLAYALGMALVYTLFGVAAGLAGEGLAAALQTPWVLTAFAALLVLLSLSMFGLYELQIPASWQSGLSQAGAGLPGGRFGGVFLMGGLSALIVGPCVAAPLAGALVYISQTRDAALGGMALFAMACGMSVPLVLVGASAGTLLPRAGAWMTSVKRFFGLLLLAVALWMVSPVWPVAWVMGAAGAILLAAAAMVLRGRDAGRPGPLAWVVAGGLALLGGAELAGALTGARDPLRPVAHLLGEADAPHGITFRRIRSAAELDEALRTAGRPVMFDFYADWCVSCKEMERFTFTDPRVQAALAPVLLLQVDVTANGPEDRALLRRFGLFGPPAILFFDARGRELADRRVIGFQGAAAFLASLEAAGIAVPAR